MITGRGRSPNLTSLLLAGDLTFPADDGVYPPNEKSSLLSFLAPTFGADQLIKKKNFYK